jgi:hypothetical protein
MLGDGAFVPVLAGAGIGPQQFLDGADKKVDLGWSRGGITRALALLECVLTKPAIQRASSGSASRWSQRPTMSADPMAVVAAKILASPSWSRCTAT